MCAPTFINSSNDCSIGRISRPSNKHTSPYSHHNNSSLFRVVVLPVANATDIRLYCLHFASCPMSGNSGRQLSVSADGHCRSITVTEHYYLPFSALTNARHDDYVMPQTFEDISFSEFFLVSMAVCITLKSNLYVYLHLMAPFAVACVGLISCSRTRKCCSANVR